MLDFGHVSLATLLEARLLVMDAVVRAACERASGADIEELSRNVTETIELTRQGRYEERTLKARWSSAPCSQTRPETRSCHIGDSGSDGIRDPPLCPDCRTAGPC